MFKRLLKGAAIALGVVVLLALVLYAFGFRISLYGGGVPRLSRPKSLDQQAAEIAAHRQAQRGAPVPAPAAPAAAAGPSRAAANDPAPSTPALPAAPPPAAPPYWTNFRGPLRDGHYRERPILTAWPSTGLRPIWKQPVGAGHASFVAAGGRAFTIEQRGRDEVVAAYDVATGREVWTNTWRATFDEIYGGVGPRATPTWHDGTLYALGATGELRALDAATGRMHWRTNILQDAGASNLQWGMAASPLVVGGTIVVLPGGPGSRSIAAYDRATGKIAWTALDDMAAYSSPMLARLAGVDQILVFAATRLVSVSVDGGHTLWEFPWKTQGGIHVAQPLVIDGNRVFISSGYGTGAALIEISADGDRLGVRELWRTNRMKNQFTSSVLHDGFIYGLDEAILACLDAATGDLKWKGGRYGHGQVILASDHLVVVTEDGELALVRATPERHTELARAAALDGRTWNHPAMADGYLLVRNAAEMAAFDLRVNR